MNGVIKTWLVLIYTIMDDQIVLMYLMSQYRAALKLVNAQFFLRDVYSSENGAPR